MSRGSNKDDTDAGSRPRLPAQEEIQAWMISYLAELLKIPIDEVEVSVSFDRYGLDSASAIVMTGDLEEWLGREVDPTLIYDYPTIETLARKLASKKK